MGAREHGSTRSAASSPRRGRRPPALQVVGSVLYQPGHVAGRDQLGDGDHRLARPRAQSAHEPAGARMGDPGLHDRVDGARSERRAPVRPVRAQARLHRGLRGLCPRFAGGRLLTRRHGAHPVADPAGHRRLLPVRQRSGPRHRRIPPPPAGLGHGGEHHGGCRRTRAWTGARRCSGGRLLALVFWFNVPFAWPGRCGVA